MSNIWSALLGAGSLLGGNNAANAAKRYYRAQTRLADLMGGQYGEYMPKINRLLLNVIQRGGAMPSDAAAQRGAEADADAYFRQALAGVLKSNGLAGLDNSWQRQQSTLSLARARADNLARQRVSRLGTQDARVWDALQLLGGNAGAGGKAALSGYGRLGNAQQDQASQAWSILASVLARLGAQ